MKRLYTAILRSLHKVTLPDRLKMNNRNKCKSAEFKNDDRLYRSFNIGDLDENGKIELTTIKFPDLSCNWSKFSCPSDIWYRDNGSLNDGCYSFSVKESRHNNIATPVHDPQENNFSHTEVRVIRQDTSDEEKSNPKKGKKINSDTKKLAYRTYIRGHLKIHLTPQ